MLALVKTGLAIVTNILKHKNTLDAFFAALNDYFYDQEPMPFFLTLNIFLLKCLYVFFYFIRCWVETFNFEQCLPSKCKFIGFLMCHGYKMTSVNNN